ncbi:MAG TPA: carboxylesterase family protein, partial [Silvibacterium sp.]|nr:carboxylesterase family protein [Silvibacterium sp.]
PVGDLRWREPKTAVSWAGVRDATKFGNICYQTPDGARFPSSSLSEDCLYLNVWTPSLKPAQPAPVMVFIHGGSFVSGSGSQAEFDGANLAARGVVIVTINYRLGVFGFLAHPDLSAESPRHTSGNYGLLDQMAALRWVRNNIGSLGGDPRNVTVFGESAGASSIGYLLVAPDAKDLFDKAILESPSIVFQPAPELRNQYRGLTSMEEIGLAVGPHIAELRSLTGEELMARGHQAAQKLFGAGGTGRARLRPETPLDNPSFVASPWAPFADGVVIPGQPALLYTENRTMRIPVLVGTNTNEGNLFLRQYHPTDANSFDAWVEQAFAPCGKQVLALYAPASPTSPEQIHAAADRLLTDSIQLYNAFSIARATHGFLYRFTHVSPLGELSGMGAYHSSELAYVFGHTHVPDARHPDVHFKPQDHKLSDQMMTMWVHFARTSDPRLMMSSDWTRIGSNGEVPYMDFGDTLAVKDLPDTSLQIFSELWPPSGKTPTCAKK